MNFTQVQLIKQARRPHRCGWCDEPIAVGDAYNRYRYFDGGDAGTVKMHPECYDAMAEAASHWGEVIEFSPGENPRGCNCGHTEGCERCAALAGKDQEPPQPPGGGDE